VANPPPLSPAFKLYPTTEEIIRGYVSPCMSPPPTLSMSFFLDHCIFFFSPATVIESFNHHTILLPKHSSPLEDSSVPSFFFFRPGTTFPFLMFASFLDVPDPRSSLFFFSKGSFFGRPPLSLFSLLMLTRRRRRDPPSPPIVGLIASSEE